MQRTLLGFLLISSIAIGQETKVIPAAKLQGKWEVVEMNMAGDQVDPKAIFGGVTWEIRDDKLTIQSGKRDIVHIIAVDDKKEPAWLDMNPQNPEFNGKIARGIYKLDGDELRVSIEVRGKGDRPKDFSLPDLASGCNLYRMKRVK